MHSRTAKAIFTLGAKYRNPSLWKEYERLKESEWLSASKLHDLQIERASRFFKFVGKHSEYYKKIFDKIGFNPENFVSIESITKIPEITKTQLINDNKKIHTDFNFGKIFVAETSGTTGTALKFIKNETWDSINRANVMRAYDWYGVKPWDRYGYFWGYDIASMQAVKVKIMDRLQNRFRIFRYDKQSIENFANRLVSAVYVAGYSSMIYEVAKLINVLDLVKPQLKLVKGTSEMILDVYQPEVKAAFGRNIVSEYGAAESGLVAFECPEGNMHINIEDVIIETDEDGEIIITNLASYSFPIIRYRLGDIVKVSNEACQCGRSHPILKEIAGRKGSVVIGKDGSYPALTFYYVFKNLALHNSILLNYKAVQKEKGNVQLFIEGHENNRHENLLMDELLKYFDRDVDFSIKYISNFDKQRGKTQYFESLL